MPTAQEVFDAAAGWLLTQKEQCTSPEVFEVDDEGEQFLASGGYCVYRSPDGTNACAVGAFMPDDLARRVDEDGEQAFDQVVSNYPGAPDWFAVHYTLLSDLQSVHDVQGDRAEGLGRVAKKYGLTFSGRAS
jgi:hypothetical protein